jgi:hypothetical protein
MEIGHMDKRFGADIVVAAIFIFNLYIQQIPVEFVLQNVCDEANYVLPLSGNNSPQELGLVHFHFQPVFLRVPMIFVHLPVFQSIQIQNLY